MGGLTLVLMAVCACATIVGVSAAATNNGPVPEYSAAVANYKDAVNKLKQYAPNPNERDVKADNPKLHYGLVVVAVYNVVDAVARSCVPVTYDQYYLEGVKQGVQYGWTNPQNVGQEVEVALSKVNDEVQAAVQLVENTCKNNPNNCDEKVYAEVNSNPEKYQQAADTLVAVGKAAKVYLKNTYEADAQKYQVVKVLVEGKEKFREFVHELVHAYKKVREGDKVFRDGEGNGKC